MGLRELKVKEIERFASRPKVKRIAVENFLMTVHHNESALQANQNLNQDAKLYKWNIQTIAAVQDGIQLAATA